MSILSKAVACGVRAHLVFIASAMLSGMVYAQGARGVVDDDDFDDDSLSNDTEIFTLFTDPNDPDTDDDGICDHFRFDNDGNGIDPADPCQGSEIAAGTELLDPDSDDDSLPDGAEDQDGDGALDDTETSPLDPDTDDDGLCDHSRADNEAPPDGIDPADACGGSELDAGTDPRDPDTDDGGVNDGTEVLIDGTDPVSTPQDDILDSDNDGLFDWAEVNIFGTDPIDGDTDDDGLLDGTETSGSTDPLDPDTDSDGVQDGTELGLDVPETIDTDPATFVPDGDAGATTTDPTDADTDDDGLSDGAEDQDSDGEVDASETDPNDQDTDSDGVQDGTELGLDVPDSADTDPGIFVPDGDGGATTTDPTDADSDDDSLIDGKEDTDFNGTMEGLETDPNDPDTDDDGLCDDTRFDNDNPPDGIDPADDCDGSEVQEKTDPLDPDSDKDGYSDGQEVALGTDPNDPKSFPPDEFFDHGFENTLM